MSSITRAFYRQIVRENRIPLNLSYGEPNRESREALLEAEQIARRGTSRFADADEMFDALGI